MKNKLMLSLVILVLFGFTIAFIYSYNVPQSFTSPTEYPAIMQHRGISTLSCDESSAYDKQFLPFKDFSKVSVVSSNQEFNYYVDAYDNGWRIFDSNGKSPRGMTDSEHTFKIYEGIYPQIDCNDEKHCNYNAGGKSFYLASDGRCYLDGYGEQYENSNVGTVDYVILSILILIVILIVAVSIYLLRRIIKNE